MATPKHPSAKLVKYICDHSIANVFHEAKREWVGLYRQSYADYAVKCCCNQPLIRTNVAFNLQTKCVTILGCNCATWMGLIDEFSFGNCTSEDGNIDSKCGKFEPTTEYYEKIVYKHFADKLDQYKTNGKDILPTHKRLHQYVDDYKADFLKPLIVIVDAIYEKQLHAQICADRLAKENEFRAEQERRAIEKQRIIDDENRLKQYRIDAEKQRIIDDEKRAKQKIIDDERRVASYFKHDNYVEEYEWIDEKNKRDALRLKDIESCAKHNK